MEAAYVRYNLTKRKAASHKPHTRATAEPSLFAMTVFMPSAIIKVIALKLFLKGK
jgi:hypothetical protein